MPTRSSHPAMKIVYPLLLTLAAAGAAGACAGEAHPESDETATPGAPVEIEVAVQDTIRADVRVVGTLESAARVVVRAEASGRVEEVPVEEGSVVGRGDLLVRLDTAILRAEVAAARARVTRTEAELENLERRLERNRDLLDEGAIAPQEFDDLEASTRATRAALEEARAGLALAERRLADASIEAPFSGRLGERVVDPGDYVTPGDSLFQLVDTDPLEIEFPVPERYLGRIGQGSEVEVQVQNRLDEIFEGRVSFMSPVVDPENRSVMVKARIPNPDGVLQAGQFADVRLLLELRAEATVIPEAAVVPGRTQDVVFVVRGDVVERRAVELGARSRNRVEITSGVEPGDTVVVAGQQRLQDGARVAVQTVLH